ncbi:hypothetical protein N656DRAFT_61619 [Canariomyces notabilis]|uniref:Uncharacterized protein n=1 Tax=Canariomyces notabilis TaxID=2074819 RepID=A0AAN6TP56_9PEZI|nr:hypothetical protein N656DRAFT_61619 [Canariomyces arenarius]
MEGDRWKRTTNKADHSHTYLDKTRPQDRNSPPEPYSFSQSHVMLQATNSQIKSCFPFFILFLFCLCSLLLSFKHIVIVIVV